MMEKRVKEWMISYIASVLDCEAETIEADATFDILGLDSVEAVIMAGLMEEEFRVAIDPLELYENPSIAAFAAHFVKQHAQTGSEAGTPA
ncbi:acyl carrier protein [Pseudoruegeria sp. SHC-113]|uniref:acyl carrier protein n=1 Tax=Pseudoruegeria sp. SHC-113 TaxID=2855439 RepID=UPI0021BB86A5|nr:acyl carrier protein [Pseudoruegeria sp. SHC-113]MCT8160152.1 acyl carrier protein [Pseudoruegeria sp. SHC-113]